MLELFFGWPPCNEPNEFMGVIPSMHVRPLSEAGEHTQRALQHGLES